MVPADVFKPPAEASYTVSQVKRAGRLLRKFYARIPEPGADSFDGWDVDKVVDAMYALTWWRLQHASALKKVAANLRYHVRAAGALADGQVDVTQRLKRRTTILDKLRREPTMALTTMQDIAGVRARLPSLRHVAAVSRRLKKSWTIVATNDYIAEPKDSGYRAVHHIVRRDGRLVELQLRTLRQDAWANQVETDGRLVHVGFKFGAGDDEVHEYYRVIAEAFAALDRGEDLTPDLVAQLNSSYASVADQLGRFGPQNK
jgi:ppGpp synthetase/RelA/SpoT-type nucleotidyltranferase